MTPREEVEQTARELTDSYDMAVGKSTMKFYRHREDKVRPKAAALLRSLLAERDEAIKHCEAMAKSWEAYCEADHALEEDAGADMAQDVEAFRAWMEGRK